MEILTGSTYRFYAHGKQGSNYVIMGESNNIGAMESIHSGDLDSDGKNEIYLGTGNGSLFVTNFNGATLNYEYILPLSTMAITHLGAGDVDGDGKTEIIAVEGHTGISWNENFVFRSAGSDAIVYVIGYSGTSYTVEDQINVDVGGAFCAEVGDVDNDGIPEILLGGTGYDEVNSDPFVGQIEVIDYSGGSYSVVWESLYFSNWVMGVAIGDVDGDGKNEIVTEDYDEDLESNVLRFYEYNGATYTEYATQNIDSENMALAVGDSDGDMTVEIATKGIFGGLLEVFGKSGPSYPREWSSSQFTTFIDECIEVTDINPGGPEYLIFGELGVFIYEYTGSTYQEIWHTAEVPASVKNLHMSDIDMYSGKDLIGSSGGYNFIYGEGDFPVAVLSVSDFTVDVGEVITFDGSGSFGSGSLEYYFEFGDGDTTGWTPSSKVTHSYSSQGTYTASLRVRDQSGDQSPQPAKVTIMVSQGSSGKPVAIIDSISPNPAAEGDTIHFEGHGQDDPAIVDYEWSSSIVGSLSNEAEFDYISLPVGDHVISFRVKNENNVWSDYVTSDLRVNQKPEAKIDAINPKSPNEGDSVSFTGHGSDDSGIVGYQWRSSINGFLSNKAAFSTSQLSVGSHIIYFKVMDSDGAWSDEVSKGVNVNQIPVAIIDSISPNETIVGEPVTFEGSGDDDGNIAGYLWESDIDGFLSSRSTFSASSLSVGVHTILFSVRDNKGAWSEVVERTIIISEIPPNIIPRAFIDEVSPAKVTEGEDVNFIGHGEDEDGGIEEYFWESDFDGLLSDERSFVTSDLSVGTHVITLRVRDDVGDWSEPDEVVLIVKEKEEEDFFASFSPASFEEEPEICTLYIIFVIVIIVGIVALVAGRRKRKRQMLH